MTHAHSPLSSHLHRLPLLRRGLAVMCRAGLLALAFAAPLGAPGVLSRASACGGYGDFAYSRQLATERAIERAPWRAGAHFARARPSVRVARVGGTRVDGDGDGDALATTVVHFERAGRRFEQVVELKLRASVWRVVRGRRVVRVS